MTAPRSPPGVHADTARKRPVKNGVCRPPLRFRSLTVAEPDLPTFGDLPESGASRSGSPESLAAPGGRSAGRATLRRTRLHDSQLVAPRRNAAFDLHCLRRGPTGRHRKRTTRLREGPVGRRTLPKGNRRASRGGRPHLRIHPARGRQQAASKPVLAGLFHTAYLYASRLHSGCTHAVIEVNPRHVVFYGRALRFDPSVANG